MPLSRGFCVRVILALLVVPATASAQVVSVGTEFQVNTYTLGDQYQTGPAVCTAGNGDFVIVWQSGSPVDGDSVKGAAPVGKFGSPSNASGFDGDEAGIFAQRYASNGAPKGTEFQLNSYTIGAQVDPALCCQTDGDFVVTWTNATVDVFPPIEFGEIHGQRFASSGAFLGTEFQVNAYTSEPALNADICCAADGDFVVVWNDLLTFPPPGGFIAGRRFDSSGAPKGTEFLVSDYLDNDPGVCCDAAGAFVVAWTQYTGPDSVFDVFAQRYASNGAARGTEFQVNTYTTDIQWQANLEFPLGFLENQAICCDNAGDFTVAWSSYALSYPSSDVRGQRFASNGSARGTEFQVNAYTTGDQVSPAACCGPNGGFVITWMGQVGVHESGSEQEETDFIFGRRFGANGAPVSGDFQVNTYTSGSMYFPAVACGPGGNFVVSWTQFPNEDGDGAGVFAKRLAPLELVPTPALSWLGLGAAVVALFSVGIGAFRRRK